MAPNYVELRPLEDNVEYVDEETVYGMYDGSPF
jgi:hypothetical protein